MVQFGYCCRRNKGDNSYPETPPSVTMATEFDLTVLKKIIMKKKKIAEPLDCVDAQEGQKSGRWFGASSRAETVKGQIKVLDGVELERSCADTNY